MAGRARLHKLPHYCQVPSNKNMRQSNVLGKRRLTTPEEEEEKEKKGERESEREKQKIELPILIR